MSRQARNYIAQGGSTIHAGPYVAVIPAFPTAAPDFAGRAFVAVSYHMDPDEAERLAADLLEAAAEARRAGEGLVQP